MNKRTFMAGAVALLGLAGCVSKPKDPELEVRGLVFQNWTGAPIESAELLVPVTGGVASCSYIAQDGHFSTVFPMKQYRKNPLEVTWRVRGESYETGPVLLEIPSPLPLEPVVGVVRFRPNGEADIFFGLQRHFVKPSDRYLP